MEDGEIRTTVTLELEGKLVHAVSDKTVEQIAGMAQAEHLIPVTMHDEEIWIQGGNIEFLRPGDHRSDEEKQKSSEPG